MRVAFLSEWKPIPFGTIQHRCNQPAEYLELAGLEARVQWVYDFRLDLAADIIIISRVPMNLRTREVIRAAKANGTIVLYDTDDLLFDADIVPYLSEIGHPLTYRDVERRLAILQACDAVITSTNTLAKAIRQLGKRTVVLRNGLSASFLRHADQARRWKRSEDSTIVIGYLSGSPTHDRDFAQVADVLSDLLELHPHVRLVIVGYLTIPDSLLVFGPRVQLQEFVPYTQLPSQLAQIDINLAPLEVNEPFCQAKSELKYVEAGACGIVTVAAATEPYRLAIRHGENGFLAETTEDWHRILNQLVQQPELISAVGAQAKVHVLANYTPQVRAREWKSVMVDFVNEASNLRKQATMPETPPVHPVKETLFVLAYRIALIKPIGDFLRLIRARDWLERWFGRPIKGRSE